MRIKRKLQTLLASCAILLGSAACSTVQELPRRSFLNGDSQIRNSVEQISMLIGHRTFEDARWEPVEDQFLVGLSYLVHPNSQWLGLEFGLSYSENHTRRVLTIPGDVNLKARIWELTGGLRKEIRLGDSPLRVYASGGAAVLFVDAMLTDGNENDIYDDKDIGVAPYVRVGIFWDIEEFNGALGLDLKHVRSGTVDIAGREPEIDSTQIGLTFSYTL